MLFTILIYVAIFAAGVVFSKPVIATVKTLLGKASSELDRTNKKLPL